MKNLNFKKNKKARNLLLNPQFSTFFLEGGFCCAGKIVMSASFSDKLKRRVVRSWRRLFLISATRLDSAELFVVTTRIRMTGNCRVLPSASFNSNLRDTVDDSLQFPSSTVAAPSLELWFVAL